MQIDCRIITRWLVEPVVYGYALAGALICFGVGALPESSAAEVAIFCHILGYRFALTFSFLRATLDTVDRITNREHDRGSEE